MADAMEARPPSAMQTTTFTVLGICCSSEIKLIDRILNHLEGIENVSVNVLAKTATVVHDPAKAPASRIVQIESRPWPSASVVASGALLLVALCSYAFPPLIWIALLSVTVGVLGMLRRAVAALRRCVLDINVLMARVSLESLLNLAPQTAVIAETGETVHVKDIMINTIVSVKAGELVPVDGAVVAGASTVDESSLTGEFMPVDKEIGSNVETKAVAEDSAVARMVKLVEDAQNRRSHMEEFIEQFAKYYTPGL
ncbi:hypothetical protein B296_00019767 [Ensete ventricosum]|uniref:HMA domain-containing protein n=1 Tax=Ensete ventricosum TaxID=4639 RepID=A0A427A8N3_ENSVE|nr:hypothetical protein B296_00019767 [Ensete ventricosum]